MMFHTSSTAFKPCFALEGLPMPKTQPAPKDRARRIPINRLNSVIFFVFDIGFILPLSAL
jgi:hypothetical protein